MSDELELVDLEEIIDVPAPAIRIKESPAIAPILSVGPREPKSIGLGEIVGLIEEAEKYFGSDIADLTPLQQLVILAYLKTGNPSRACALAGATVVKHHKWLESDDKYRSMFTVAEAAITDRIEQAGIEGAIGGDARLILGILKGRRRSVYGAQKNEEEKQANSWSDLARTLAEEKSDA